MLVDVPVTFLALVVMCTAVMVVNFLWQSIVVLVVHTAYGILPSCTSSIAT